MTTAWVYSEDLVFDYWEEAPPKAGAGPEILDVESCSDLPFLGGDEEECSDWGDALDEIEEALHSREDGPHTTIPTHQPSGLDDWPNAAGQLDLDLLPQEVLSEMEIRWPSHDRSLAAKSTSFSAVAASALIHLCLFPMFAFVPETQVAGAAGNAGNVISVRITAPEDLIPQDESPASVDSAASMPSTAGMTKRRRKPPPVPAAQPPPEMREVGLRPEKIVMHEKPKPDEKTEEKTEPQKEVAKKPEELKTGEGPKNSIPSLPSIASVERRFIPAAGAEGKSFESMVLSAIREVIFFPKKAVKERHHGEVVVEFAINKDGSISSLHVTKTSGSSILDEAAFKIIQKAAKKFPPVPDTLKERVDYVVPILFKEKRG